ncbi:MAG: hypothetical protein ACKOBF_02180 [Limnohabitans sp.]
MMNASRPLVTPEELQCLLGWPLDVGPDPRLAEREPSPLPSPLPIWPAQARQPGAAGPAAACPPSA